MTSVAIIDDHAVVRMGLKYVLGVKKDEFSFAGEWSGGIGATDFVVRVNPDVVLLDIRMPDRDGLDVLKDILSVRPKQKVLILTTSDADNDVYNALTIGARGYLLKDRDATEIYTAISTVASGGKFVPPSIKELFEKRQMTPTITQRETTTLTHLRDGLTNDAIAEKMGVTKDAVKLHLKNIFTKLGVNDRLSAVREAIERGFIR